MITIRSESEIELISRACRISATAREKAGEMIAPGVSTADIDKVVREVIEGYGARPAFLGYNGFPASVCVSLNDEVIHGIPTKSRILREGDIVSIDLGAELDGYFGDCADTFPVGEVSETARRLIEVTRESFYKGIAFAREGYRTGDFGSAVDDIVTENGFTSVRDFVGHGIGTKLHESPEVPNYGTKGRGVRFRQGMVIAVEPMVCAGNYDVMILEDGWTVVTEDGSLSAHYENTVVITDGEPRILTVAY